jgi:hypothetical protein
MTLWKSEQSVASGPAVHGRLDPPLLSLVVAATAASGLLLAWTVPTQLFLPALSFLSFAAAGMVALFAYYSGADRRTAGITLWDVAGVFALIWIAAGMSSEPEHVVQLLGHLTMAR